MDEIRKDEDWNRLDWFRWGELQTREQLEDLRRVLSKIDRVLPPMRIGYPAFPESALVTEALATADVTEVYISLLCDDHPDAGARWMPSIVRALPNTRKLYIRIQNHGRNCGRALASMLEFSSVEILILLADASERYLCEIPFTRFRIFG